MRYCNTENTPCLYIGIDVCCPWGNRVWFIISALSRTYFRVRVASWEYHHLLFEISTLTSVRQKDGIPPWGILNHSNSAGFFSHSLGTYLCTCPKPKNPPQPHALRHSCSGPLPLPPRCSLPCSTPVLTCPRHHRPVVGGASALSSGCPICVSRPITFALSLLFFCIAELSNHHVSTPPQCVKSRVITHTPCRHHRNLINASVPFTSPHTSSPQSQRPASATWSLFWGSCSLCTHIPHCRQGDLKTNLNDVTTLSKLSYPAKLAPA